MTSSARWSDLVTRIISAAALLLMAIGASLYGRLGFGLFTAAVCGCMAWELARMHAPRLPGGAWIAGVVTAVLVIAQGPSLIILGVFVTMFLGLIVALALGLSMSRDQPVFAVYWMAILLTAQVMLVLFQPVFAHLLLLLIAVVIATDIFGYFAGRILGGPKFWPRISPKKTWSGVVAGWMASALVGIVVMIVWNGSLILPILAVLMSLASQLGDIAESAIKRRAGVKDTSDLIPGHGGFMDRFDGIVGAAMVVFFAFVVELAL